MIDFFIPHEPLPQDRARHAVRKRKDGTPFTATYDTSRSRQWKRLVATYGKKAIAEPYPPREPLKVAIFFFMTKPVSTKRELPSVKPDLSNLLKGIEDGLNGIAWHDDGQICQIKTTKIYSDKPGVRICIDTMVEQTKLF